MNSSQSTKSLSEPERPATAFLSYKRKDADQVKSLQQQLKARGVRAWRDVTHMPPGGFTEREIIQAIKHGSDAFVIYITPECLQSDFIWDIEVPAAIQRWEQDQAYNIIPILQGVTFAQIQPNSTARGYRTLTDFNAVLLPDPDHDKEQFNKELRSIAERILMATYTLRLRRVGADRTYEPHINFHTFRYEPPTPTLDLDLDWTELFEGQDEVPTRAEWDDLLLPALNDVKNMLSVKTPSRKLHIYSNARLPAAIALGAAIPAPAHFELLLHSNHDTWSTKGTPTDSSPLRLLPSHEKGDTQTALIELAISRNTAPGIAQSLPISYKHRLRFEPKDEPPNTSAVKNAAHALAMSRQIGMELRNLCDNKGISHLHLFAALPVELAVMVGHQLNALCAVTLYYYRNSDQRYVPTCTLK
jgi:SMODS-associated and fused to various effectors sensor domain/TIR domain